MQLTINVRHKLQVEIENQTSRATLKSLIKDGF